MLFIVIAQGREGLKPGPTDVGHHQYAARCNVASTVQLRETGRTIIPFVAMTKRPSAGPVRAIKFATVGEASLFLSFFSSCGWHDVEFFSVLLESPTMDHNRSVNHATE